MSWVKSCKGTFTPPPFPPPLLPQVFASIREGALHVPYRNSKLTHILQPCIGGDSKVRWILTGLVVMWVLVGDEVEALVGDDVGALVGDDVGALVGDDVGALVGDDVGALVGGNVGALVGDDVGVLVGDDVGALVGDDVGALVGGNVCIGLVMRWILGWWLIYYCTCVLNNPLQYLPPPCKYSSSQIYITLCYTFSVYYL